MNIIINGDTRAIAPGVTLEGLLAELGIDRRKVAVERNLEIVPRSAYAQTTIGDGDRLEIVHFIGGGSPGAETSLDADPLVVAGRKLSLPLDRRHW